MTPGEILTNLKAELEADPSMSIEMYYREDDDKFYVEISSDAEQRVAQGSAKRTLKGAVARALNIWNGDAENGKAS